MAVLLITSCSTSSTYEVEWGSLAYTIGNVYDCVFSNLSVPNGCYTVTALGTTPLANLLGKTDYAGCVECLAANTTPTPTPTNTETPTPTNTETPTPTTTATYVSPSQTPTNTPTSTVTPTNTETPTETQTPTPTPTETETPTPTPTITQTLTPTTTQCICNYWDVSINNTELLSATGNTLYANNTIYVGYKTCAGLGTVTDTILYTVPGLYTDSFCNYASSIPQIYYFVNDVPVNATLSTITNTNNCCVDSTPTPTPTNTETPTPTNTETPTPTVTPTNTQTPTNTPTVTSTPSVTPTEPYDVYLFEECGNSSNQFRFEYVSGTLVVGDVYLISGPYFNGYATVLPYVATGTLYNATGSVFTQQASCPTPTPTPTTTSTPTTTPTTTMTPTVTSSPGSCTSTYCFNTTLSTLSGYSGNYVFTGLTYGGYNVYVGDGTTIGYVYHTGSNWCLSSSLGGTCLLSGTNPCISLCPDISANNFTSGPCPTPTPSPVNCETFDFTAYFDCDWEPLPTPSPSIACDDVDFSITSLGVTPTPTPSGNFCDNTGVSFSICQYNPATPTATPTPTITLTKTVDVQGQATFVMLDEMFNCVNVKILVDCQTGNELYTSDNLIFSGTPVTTGITMSVIINGSLMCVTYTGTSNTISSNCNVEEIIALSSTCGTCNQFPSATPTTTLTSTPTPTLTPTMTSNATPTPTPNTTPTPTPNWRYVYESCQPLGNQVLKTQVIQTVKVVPTSMTVNQTFQDNQGRCWKYLGQFPTNYIAPPTVLSITYTGNYMGGTLFQAVPLFNNCTDCLNWQGFSVEYFGNYSPSSTSAQNACLSYSTGRPYYTNTTSLAVGVRVYDVFTSVPTNGNNNWVVLKIDPALAAGKAVQINTQGYITAIQNVDTNSC